jgi:hypothetical protein
MNPKLTPDRLHRRAIVYIRQSTPGQLIHNQESQRRQYGLVNHARELGFSEVIVIDAPDQAWSSALDSNVWSLKSAPERWAPSSASRLRAWHATVATGTI